MSQSSLAKAVRDVLQARLGLDRNECDVRLDGRPPALAGELFVAVHGPSWRIAVQGDVGVNETFGVSVTITRRSPFAPEDRQATAVWLDVLQNEGMAALARTVYRELAGDNTGDLQTQSRYLLLIAANKILHDDEGLASTPPHYWEGGFVEPLKLLDGGRPERKLPSWFSAAVPEEGAGNDLECGVAQTLVFGEAVRAQILSEMT